jgi:hypothetical protein
MHSAWRGIAKPCHEARVAVAAHLLALGLLLLLCGLRAPGRLVGAASWTIAEPSAGITVRVDARGSYTIAWRSPAWTFGGTLGRPLTHVAVGAGTDGIGRYRDVAFRYHVDAARIGRIRLYHGKPIVLFSVTYLAPARNTAPFPALTTYPHTPYHMSFGGPFGIYRYDLGGQDSPWLLFDSRANAFILSPASDFMVAATTKSRTGAIASGINRGIAGLPRGLTHRTILVVGKGINATFDTWGHAMTDLAGKRRPANDADVGLRNLGYWTDHGAAYYYHDEAARGYAGTLLAVRDEFRTKGVPLGYMQLDSWWYPKGPSADWRAGGGGEYTYTAAPALFPLGLRAFQRRLGLPLITHARWIDAHSPYRRRYAMSNNVSIDPRFWAAIAGYLKKGGVRTYEQDWLSRPATAANTIAAQNAFMDGMARATSRNGLSMQYCLPQPRHYLQSTRYDNLYTMRVSNDRFGPSRWTQFLYGARLAGALGVWPWADVFMSAERDNLLLATLSGGMVGVGDPLGAVDRADLLQAVRTDGVIVKPDAPIVPIDAVYLDDARGMARPMVAWTYSDHGGMRAAYVFAYPRGTATAATFVPASLGLSGRVYVYNYATGRGALLTAGQTFYATVHGGSYEVVVPVGRSGIAFLGDAGKFVSLGKQRIPRLRDDGAVHATIAFAAGEKAVTLHGYAPSRPAVTATKGAAGPATYDAASGRFSVAVSPAPDGTAAIRIAAAPPAG